MTYKWNLDAATVYAETLAQKICADFFSDKDEITGEQLLDLTEIDQVNLLVIRTLYQKWQSEIARLKSPYFDYSNEEVSTALTQFVNILSKHISIKETHFKPLLAQSFFQTLALSLSPTTFYEKQLNEADNAYITPEWASQLGRYIRINTSLFDQWLQQLPETGLLFTEASAAFSSISAKEELENPAELFARLETIAPVPSDLTYEEPKIIPTFPSAANKSFFEQEIENRLLRKIQEPHVPSVPATPKEHLEKTKNEDTFIPSSLRQVETPKMPEAPKLDERPNVIPSQSPKPVANLNDSQGSGAFLNSLNEQSKIESIKSSLSLNQKFLFLNGLFKGDALAFQETLHELDHCANYQEARDKIVRKFVPKFLWDVSAHEVEELMDMVKRRYA